MFFWVFILCSWLNSQTQLSYSWLCGTQPLVDGICRRGTHGYRSPTVLRKEGEDPLLFFSISFYTQRLEKCWSTAKRGEVFNLIQDLFIEPFTELDSGGTKTKHHHCPESLRNSNPCIMCQGRTWRAIQGCGLRRATLIDVTMQAVESHYVFFIFLVLYFCLVMYHFLGWSASVLRYGIEGVHSLN